MKTEFNPLEALADISEDELNEFIELQEEAPKKRRRQKTRESFVCFISFYESIKSVYHHTLLKFKAGLMVRSYLTMNH